MVRITTPCLVAVLVGFCLQAQPVRGQEKETYLIEAGKPHANFALPEIDGSRNVRLNEFRGKKLLLFHFASW